jgi:hypothetical protein
VKGAAAVIEAQTRQGLSSFLYETSPLDPLIDAPVTFLLLAVTEVACLRPARRAARFDPVGAVRHD